MKRLILKAQDRERLWERGWVAVKVSRHREDERYRPKVFNEGDRLWVPEPWQPLNWDDDFDWLSFAYNDGVIRKVDTWSLGWDDFDLENMWDKMTAETARLLTQHEVRSESDLPPDLLKKRPQASMPKGMHRIEVVVSKVFFDKGYQQIAIRLN